MKSLKISWFLLLTLLIITVNKVHAQRNGNNPVKAGMTTLSEREEVMVMESFWKWKLEHLLPEIMRQENTDMWIVRNSEGPVYVSLVPADHEGMVLSTPSFLIFHDRGEKAGIERLEGRFADFSNIVKERNPRKIGMKITTEGYRADGFTPSDKTDLEQDLGSRYASRLVSSTSLRMKWLTIKGPQELSAYRHVVRMNHAVIAEALSNNVIIPDVTTTADLNWWIVNKYLEHDFLIVDHPSVWINRRKQEIDNYPASAHNFYREPIPDNTDQQGRGKVGNGAEIIIRRGDLIGLDSGIMYLGLNTDTKAYGYVLKAGETDAPEGLREGLRRANRLQDIVAAEWKQGMTGNEIARIAAQKAEAEGLHVRIYSHADSYFLKRYTRNGLYFSREHFFAGTSFRSVPRAIGETDPHDLPSPPLYDSFQSGDVPLQYNTVTAFEMSINHIVPEWDNQGIDFEIEENAMFTEEIGFGYLDGRQTTFHIIK